MPLTRYQLRNEYSLADPELYTAADKDDAEALLEGVAMAGLVGVLRQLGDLAEFAAGVFHDLHEEVLATAARGHDLKVRVQQLEAEVPSVEKALLSQTNHASFFTNPGMEWHPNLRTEQNLITRGDLPRCVMDSYEESRAPPCLFQLDKYDVAGAGACLKRYTDPSFCKVEATVELQREKKIRKKKKKGSHWRNGETPEVVPTSHAKLHQLFLEERIENAYSDPARRVKLKRRQLNESLLDPKSGKSYMEKFVESPSPENKMVCETSVTPPLLNLASDHSSPSGLEIIAINTTSPVKKPSQENKCTEIVKVEELFLRRSKEESDEDAICTDIVKVPDSIADSSMGEIPPDHHHILSVNKEDVDHSDDQTSEADNYVDALTTLESEKEIDKGFRRKNDLFFLSVRKKRMHTDANEEQLGFHAHPSDCQSAGIFSSSEDGNNSFKGGRSNLSYSDTVSYMTEDPPSDNEGATNIFLYTEYRASEAAEAPSIHPPAYELAGGPNSNEVESPKGTFLDEERLCEDGEESSTHSIDTRQSSVVASSVVKHVHEEIPFNVGKHDSELLNSDENGTSPCDSPEAVSVGPYEIQDDSPFTVSSEQSHVDGLGSGNASASSNGFLPLSKVSQLDSEHETNGDCLNGVIPTDNEEGTGAENPPFTVSSEKSYEDGLDSGNVNASSNGVMHLSNVSQLASESETNGDYSNEVIQTDNEEETGAETPPFTVSSLKSHVDGLGSGNENVYSNGLLHVSHISQLASLEESNGDSLDEVVQADYEETAAENSADQIVCSPKSISPSTERQLVCSTLPETENRSGTTSLPDSMDDMKYGNLVSEDCDTVSEIGANLEDSSRLMGHLPTHTVDEKQVLLCDPSQVKVDASEVEAACPEQETYLDEVSEAAETEEVERFAHEVDAVEKNASPLDLDSDLKSETETVKAQAEDAVPSAAAPVSLSSDVVDDTVSESSNPISSPARNLLTSEESLSGTTSLDQEGSGINGVLCEEYLTETETQKHTNKEEVALVYNEVISHENLTQSVVQNEMNQAEVGPTDSDSTPLVSNNCATEDVIFHYAVADPTKSSSSFGAPEVSSELTNQKSGLRCLHENHLEENTEEVISGSAPLVSGPGISSEQPVNVQALGNKNDQLEGESLSPLHFPSSQTESQIDREHQEDSPSQPPTIELLPPLASKELEINKQEMDPNVSSSGQFSEATQVNMEEMPPLPPLPPMQWRTGKVLHSSSPSHRELGGQGSFFMPHYFPEQNAQFGLSAIQGGFLQYGSPFSNFAHVEEEKSRLRSEQGVTSGGQPTPFFMNLPRTVDNTNSQYWGISSSDRSGFMNPFFMLPAAYNGRPLYGFDTMEGKWVKPNGLPLTPVPAIEYPISRVDSASSHEMPTPPQSQLVLDRSSEKEESQHSTRNSEEEHENPNHLAVPPSSEMQDQVEEQPLTKSMEEQQHNNVEEQPQHGPVASEGEEVQTSSAVPLPGLSSPEGFWSSNALSLSLPAEMVKINGNPSVKVPRPRNPLIDAVAAHDKSKLRKVSELPQNEPKENVDERNSWLEQIRKKSGNLKPAVATRPSTQGPKTNLKVAAILEKANAIRQACAGSDDDDEDSWSDS